MARLNAEREHRIEMEIVVDAHPESFQLEKDGTRVFINVPDKKEIQVADVVKRTTLV